MTHPPNSVLLDATERLVTDKTQHAEQIHYHLWEALDATATAEKHFHIRQALQLLHIERHGG